MKRIKIAALMLALLVTLTGCGSILTFLSDLDASDCYDPQKYLSEYENNWQYSLLDEETKGYYGSLYTAVMDTAATDATMVFTDENEEEQTVDGVRVRFAGARLDEADITELFEALVRDNPQFFYLDRTYRMEGHKDREGNVYYDTMLLQYLMTAEQRSDAAAQLDSALTDFLSDLPKSKDQYEIELELHDRLNRYCSYDTEAAEDDSGSDTMAYTAYGALVDGSAVCEGYAKAMQLLLHRSGIPATVINGTALWNNEPHMWNLVTINGENYYLDPTWNDNQDGGYHTYFNISTDVLARTHEIEEGQPAVTRCQATVDNYFIRNDTYIDTYERQVIAEKIATQVRAGKTFIQLQFAPEKFDNGLLFLKNGDLTFELVNGHLAKYDTSLWDYTLWVERETYVIVVEKA